MEIKIKIKEILNSFVHKYDDPKTLDEEIDKIQKRYEKIVGSFILGVLLQLRQRVDKEWLGKLILNSNYISIIFDSIFNAEYLKLRLNGLSIILYDLSIEAGNIYAKHAGEKLKALNSVKGGVKFNPQNPQLIKQILENTDKIIDNIISNIEKATKYSIVNNFAEIVDGENYYPRELNLDDVPYDIFDKDKIVTKLNLVVVGIIVGIGLNLKQAKEMTRIRLALQDLGDNPKAYEKAIEDISTTKLKSATEAIGITETDDMINDVIKMHIKELIDLGILKEYTIMKQFITAGDDRVCPTCNAMDQEVTTMDGMFSGGVSEPPVHPRCRCYIVYTDYLEVM